MRRVSSSGVHGPLLSSVPSISSTVKQLLVELLDGEEAIGDICLIEQEQKRIKGGRKNTDRKKVTELNPSGEGIEGCNR
nr:hypothetical protein Iba_chr05eCG11390 [Ipomoea batatas]